MSPELLAFLVVRSAGAGVGVFIGVLIGLGIRKRNSGKSDGLLAGSVVLTALAAAAAAMLAMMAFTWFGMR